MENLSLRTEGSIDEVVERYADMVYRLACAQTGRRDSADDVFQEVFLRLVRRNPTFASEEHRKAWLLRVTLNCCKKFGMSAWRRRVVPMESLPEREQADDFEAVALRDALSRLPERDRAVLHLYYGEDLSARQIAEITREKESSVRSRLTRARAQLRKEWGGEA
ncbi:MAG: RNA polymerase sigma factor [Candidatus Spyradocola sp.]|jgi:RNA polymerase sigma-70 factor (ECF subfamily)